MYMGSSREGLCVYHNSNPDVVDLAISNEEMKAFAIGVITNDYGPSVEIAMKGDVNILLEGGVTANPGDSLFLSGTESGKVTTIPPTAGFIVRMGIVAKVKSVDVVQATLSIAEPIGL